MKNNRVKVIRYPDKKGNLRRPTEVIINGRKVHDIVNFSERRAPNEVVSISMEFLLESFEVIDR